MLLIFFSVCLLFVQITVSWKERCWNTLCIVCIICSRSHKCWQHKHTLTLTLEHLHIGLWRWPMLFMTEQYIWVAPWEFSAGLDLTSEGSLQSPLCVCLWIETRFPESFCVPASRVLHAVCVFASFKIIFECACYVKQRFLFPSWQRVPLTWWLFWERIVQGPKSL